MTPYRADLLDLLAQTTSSFITQPSSEINANIERSLATLGQRFRVDRSYLFRLSADGSTASNTNEWCAPGIEPQIQHLQDLEVSVMPWWMGEVRSGRAINLHSLAELPESAVEEREILEPQGIQSLLVLPIIWHGRLEGFVGFDHVREARVWGAEEIHVLRVIATTFAQAFERQRVDDRLELASTVFQNAHDGIFITDKNERIIDINPTFTELTGFTRDDVIGMTPNILSSGCQGPDFYRTMWASLNSTGHWRGELWNKRKDGTHYLQRLAIAVVLGPSGEPDRYVGVFSDVTNEHQQAQRLEQLAFHDALTQLPNRVLLTERLANALQESSQKQQVLAVCYLDLDAFKSVNDRLGHEAGDRVLIEVGRRLQGLCQSVDTVARLGGDEFAVIFPSVASATIAVAKVERLLRAVSEPLQATEKETISLTVSIGVRLWTGATDGTSAESILRQADQAMYRAKQEGRGRLHVFDAAHDQALVARHEHLNMVRMAIQRNEMQFFVQPIIGIADGRVRFVEALVRWQRPDGSISPPGEWLAGIEESPVVAELGSWMLERAIDHCSEWVGKGVCGGVSVNISAYELRDADFPHRLRALLARHPTLDPACLKLEILESAALSDIETVVATMHSCRELGVCFAIDDFGTGYSSLAYLKRLPAQTLKIDRSFVADMLQDPGDHAIVKGVIELAKVFGRESVAEGVESADHLAALGDIGCDAAQGYGIAKPMPAETFAAWVAGRSAAGTARLQQ